MEIYGFASSSSPDRLDSLDDTLSDRGPTTVNQSEFATGYQQTVLNLFAETAFDCPSYWLADAFSGNKDKTMEVSVLGHYGIPRSRLDSQFSVDTTAPTRGIRHAVQKMWGSFIINNPPVITIQDAKGGASNATVPKESDGNIFWPPWNDSSPVMMDFNTTGGKLVYHTVTNDLDYWLRETPGVTNDFRLANANSWEEERGGRCQFWREVRPRVPQ